MCVNFSVYYVCKPKITVSVLECDYLQGDIGKDHDRLMFPRT